MACLGLTVDAWVCDANTEALKNKKRLTTYVVEVTVKSSEYDRTYKLLKRFRTFATLHDKLSSRFGDKGLPSLPAKTVRPNFSKSFVDKRKESLQKYIKDLASREYILNTIEFRKFLQVGQNTPDTPIYTPRRLEVFEEKPELHFANPVSFEEGSFFSGCQFSVYDFALIDAQTIVTACGDDSTISRLDTYLNKFKLPWEPSINNLYNGSVNVWVRSVSRDDVTPEYPVRFSKDSSSDETKSDAKDAAAEDATGDKKETKKADKMAWSMLERQATCIEWDNAHAELHVGTSSGQLFIYTISDDHTEVTYANTYASAHEGSRILALKSHSRNSRLYATATDKGLSVYNTKNYSCLGKVNGDGAWLGDLVFARDNTRLLCSSYSKKILVFDISNKDQKPAYLCEFSGHTASVRAMHVDSTDDRLFSCGADNTVCVWTIDNKDRRKSNSRSRNSSEASFDPLANQTPTYSSASKMLTLAEKWWNPSADSRLRCLTWCPSIDCLVTGGEKGLIQLWSLSRKICIHVWKAHATAVQKLQWIDDRHLLVSASILGQVSVWHLPDPIDAQNAPPPEGALLLPTRVQSPVVAKTPAEAKALAKAGGASPKAATSGPTKPTKKGTSPKTTEEVVSTPADADADAAPSSPIEGTATSSKKSKSKDETTTSSSKAVEASSKSKSSSTSKSKSDDVETKDAVDDKGATSSDDEGSDAPPEPELPRSLFRGSRKKATKKAKKPKKKSKKTKEPEAPTAKEAAPAIRGSHRKRAKQPTAGAVGAADAATMEKATPTSSFQMTEAADLSNFLVPDEDFRNVQESDEDDEENARL